MTIGISSTEEFSDLGKRDKSGSGGFDGNDKIVPASEPGKKPYSKPQLDDYGNLRPTTSEGMSMEVFSGSHSPKNYPKSMENKGNSFTQEGRIKPEGSDLPNEIPEN